MSIITTPKGWAIEFEQDYLADDSSHKARCLAEEYALTMHGLFETVLLAQTNESFTGDTVYFVHRILSAMLPSADDAQCFFSKKLSEKNLQPNTPPQHPSR